MITAKEAIDKYNKSGAELKEILNKICDKISCVSSQTTSLSVFFKWCPNKVNYRDFTDELLIEMRTKDSMSSIEISTILNELKKLGYSVTNYGDGELTRRSSYNNSLDYVGNQITIKW